MTEAVLAPPASRAGGNPWVVAAIVVVPTFMEVLDTTIAIVALRYIAGGLSATVDDGEWVITSYLAANAIVLPITGWLSAHLGRRNYFLLSIAVFTLASGLCGMATSLGDFLRRGSDRADLLGATPPQPRGQFPPNARAKLRFVLPNHLLCFHGALCCQHLVAGFAAVPVWL
jgi:MFS family permease